MDIKVCESQQDVENCEKEVRFDWKTDSQNAPTPQTYYIEQRPMSYLSNGMPYGFAHRDYLLAQKDPNDIIEIKTKTGEFIITAHANTWMYTFDQYLNQYIHFRNLQDLYLGKAGYVKISIPHDVMEK